MATCERQREDAQYPAPSDNGPGTRGAFGDLGDRSRGKERPPEDRAFGRRHIGSEHAIGRIRRFRSPSRVNRRRRRGHAMRVRAVVGLVGRMLAHRAKAGERRLGRGERPDARANEVQQLS